MPSLLTVVASERPLISFDGTLVINLVLWLLLFFVLRPLLWEPVVKLFAARESGMQGSRADAKGAVEEAHAKRAEYEGALKAARVSAAAARDEIRNAALKQEGDILSKARATMTEAVESQRAKIRAQREQLMTEMKATVPQLAKDIASKALGREVAS